MVVQVPWRLEAVVEDLGQPAAPRERDQAVPHVAGGRNPELLAEPAAGSPIIRDRDHRRQVADPVPQTPEQHGQPRTAAERHELDVVDVGMGIEYTAGTSSRRGPRVRAVR